MEVWIVISRGIDTVLSTVLNLCSRPVKGFPAARRAVRLRYTSCRSASAISVGGTDVLYAGGGRAADIFYVCMR